MLNRSLYIMALFCCLTFVLKFEATKAFVIFEVVEIEIAYYSCTCDDLEIKLTRGLAFQREVEPVRISPSVWNSVLHGSNFWYKSKMLEGQPLLRNTTLQGSVFWIEAKPFEDQPPGAELRYSRIIPLVFKISNFIILRKMESTRLPSNFYTIFVIFHILWAIASKV